MLLGKLKRVGSFSCTFSFFPQLLSAQSNPYGEGDVFRGDIFCYPSQRALRTHSSPNWGLAQCFSLHLMCLCVCVCVPPKCSTSRTPICHTPDRTAPSVGTGQPSTVGLNHLLQKSTESGSYRGDHGWAGRSSWYLHNCSCVLIDCILFYFIVFINLLPWLSPRLSTLHTLCCI